MSEVQRRRWIVSGKVQGVGFRYFVFKVASRLDLSGYVSNLPDGTVEAAAEGIESEIDALDQALRQGPVGSRVDSVTVTESADAALPSPFEIRT